jgi:cytochrome c553
MAKSIIVKSGLAVLAVAAFSLVSSSLVTPAAAAPLTNAELRPLFALDRDLAEGKELATSNCAKCHGLDGISATKEAPHIAAQRPTYIYRELKAYQARLRTSSDMYDKVKFLSDDALVKVAAYYGSLEPPAAPTAPAPKIVDAFSAGKAAAAGCVKCHGEKFISSKPGIPNLIGFEPKYFVETLKAYKAGDRKLDEKNEEMNKAVEALSEKDLLNVAIYIGLHKENLTHAQTPIEGNAAAITKDKLTACAKCHGEDGIGTSPATPSIAGQDATYMLKALKSYKDSSRDDDVMTPRAKKLNEQEMKDFVAYFASLTPKGSSVLKPLTAPEWAEKCDHCHGVNGNSSRPEVPALAGQKLDYLADVLRAYRAGERQSSEMSAMTSVLSDDDISAIAAFYAYQKARSVVFVTVPK